MTYEALIAARPKDSSAQAPAAPLTSPPTGMERAEKYRVLGEMASGVIHDINNMLGSILGRAQLVLTKTDLDEIKRQVQQIEMIAQQGGETVKRLLEFSRENNQNDFKPVNLNDVVASALEVTRHRWESQAQERGIVYTMDSRWGQDATVCAVRSELVDSVANIILNALDAMPAGGPLVLETFTTDGKSCISIKDSGIGMKPEQIAKAFSPFYTTKGANGTGLGLAVVYAIVTRHSGEITVQSEPGKGSRFLITLPFAQSDATAPPIPVAAVESVTRRVLLVDDDATIRDVIGEALRESGHDLHTCDGGAAAIMIMQEQPFDVLVTDLGMPGVNGWDVARRAKELDPPLPVVVISGWGAQITQEQLADAGVEMILAKPFRLEQIRQAVAGFPRRAM